MGEIVVTFVEPQILNTFFLQQEILDEVVRELHKVKDEIINGKNRSEMLKVHLIRHLKVILLS